MNDNLAVRLTDVSLAFRLAKNKTGSFKDFGLSLVKGQVKYEQFWAIRDFNLEVEKGEVLGVVGRNGAGKSTLMRLIAGVFPPTNGRVVVSGRISPLIALGAGFNQDLTARENVIMYGTLLGSSPGDMAQRVPEILEWADLTKFEHVPIRSFSSGMMARLGFSVATDIQPEVLIVDEVFAVGDEVFRAKSRDRVSALISSGATVILVSHDLERIRSFSDRAIWIDQGKIRQAGNPVEVTKRYKNAVLDPGGNERKKGRPNP